MDIENIIARIIKSVISDRRKKQSEKGFICLRGFDKSVYQELKSLYDDCSNYLVSIVASETEGVELIRSRNKKDNITNIVFLESHVSISQSIAHFPSINDLDLLKKKDYFKILLAEVVRASSSQQETPLLEEASSKIVNLIDPPLKIFIEYLIEVLKGKDIETSMGASLWKLHLFKHTTLIKSNKKPNGDLKKSFDRFIKNNYYYSGFNGRTMLPLNAVHESQISQIDKNLLFDYINNGTEGPFERIDFDTIDSIKKKKNPIKQRNTKRGEKENQVFNSPLDGILSIITNHETYTCWFESENKFQIDISPINKEDFFKPLNEYKSIYEKKMLQMEKQSQNGENFDEDENEENFTSFYVSLGESKHKSFNLKINNNIDEIKILDEIDSKLKKSDQIKSYSDINIRIKQFRKSLEKVLKSFNVLRFFTLHLDVEEYFLSYIRVLFALSTKARDLVSEDEKIFFDLLNFFCEFAIEKDEANESFKPEDYHPFNLVTKRIDEILKLELLNNEAIAGIQNNIDVNSSSFTDQLNEFKIKIWPEFLPDLIHKSNDVFTREINDDGIVAFKKKSINKSGIVDHLVKQIEQYVQINPLSQYTLNLRLINPQNGTEILKVIKKLYEKAERKRKPDHIRISAMGYEKSGTLSAFDKASFHSSENAEEIFLKDEKSIHPFCLYYTKNLSNNSGTGNWLSKYMMETNNNDGDFDADITVIIDPYKNKCIPELQFLSSQKIIDLNNLEIKENNLIESMITNSKKFKTFFESTMIKCNKEFLDDKIHKLNIHTKYHTELLRTHEKKDEWCILFDHYLTEYYAEKISEELGSDVESTVGASTGGSTYIFAYPSIEHTGISAITNNLSFLNSVPQSIKKQISRWLLAHYSLEWCYCADFCKNFFYDQKQFIIPLLDFESEEMVGLFLKSDEGSDDFGNLDIKDFALLLRFTLKNTSNFEIETKIISFNNDEIANIPYDLDMSFIRDDTKLLNIVKKERFIRLLTTYLQNPYQAWFIAALSANLVKIQGEGNKTLSQDSIVPTFPFNLWKLRNLISHLKTLYCITKEIPKDQELEIKSQFDYFETQYPDFFKFLSKWEVINNILIS